MTPAPRMALAACLAVSLALVRPRRCSGQTGTMGRVVKGWEMTAAGRTAVWATANTREALWDAMKRKETSATSGPNMVVRFFGGFDFAPADAQSRSPAVAGYTKGVSMGGDLRGAPAGKAPTFLVAALKDPMGGNLDRMFKVMMSKDVPMTTQERAWTSPIWYTPATS